MHSPNSPPPSVCHCMCVKGHSNNSQSNFLFTGRAIWNEKMACSKIRKSDPENRHFKDEWTDQYMFILPQGSTKPLLCLLCIETMALIKSGNIKRHYESKHRLWHPTTWSSAWTGPGYRGGRGVPPPPTSRRWRAALSAPQSG
jgi:hypothetical protein